MFGLRKNPGKKPVVLVVDDDPMFDGLVVDHLTQDNEYHVLSARSGEQAFRILDQSNVDVLITDIKMPNKDGFELVTRVRDEFPNISVVVVTGFGKPKGVFSDEQQGGIHFLEKPVNFSRLKKILRKAVFDAVPVPHPPTTPRDAADASMLAGQAAQFPILDMVQICCIAERTGCATLRRGDKQGRIWLDRGEIIHATAGDLTGPDAFYELARWDDADFSFSTAEQAPRQTIQCNWESVVYEGIQRRSQHTLAV